MDIFGDNNVSLLLFSIAPALFYSFIIFSRVPHGILKIRPILIYIFVGLLSITILGFIQFAFPHLQQIMDFDIIGINEVSPGSFKPVIRPSLFGIFIHAFFQIALLEELSKLIVFKSADYIRGKAKVLLDRPFAVMFYSGMISIGFAFIENISYVARAVWGDFGEMGITPEVILIERSASAVILHMLAGMFMGYFIAIGRMFAKPLKRFSFMILGLISAMFIHGAYDFVLMTPNGPGDILRITDSISFHIPSMIIILFGTLTAFVMASHLLRLRYKDKKLR